MNNGRAASAYPDVFYALRNEEVFRCMLETYDRRLAEGRITQNEYRELADGLEETYDMDWVRQVLK